MKAKTLSFLLFLVCAIFGLFLILGWSFGYLDADILALLLLPIILSLIIAGLIFMQIAPMFHKNAKSGVKKYTEEKADIFLALKNLIGYWSWDIKTNNFYYSPFFKQLLGYSTSEFPGVFSSLENCLHPDEHNKVIALLKKHTQDQIPYHIEMRLKRKTGEYHWFQAVGERVVDINGNTSHLISLITNIEEQKKLQQEIEALNRTLRAISQASSIEENSEQILQAICEPFQWDFGAIWLVDANTNQLYCMGIWQNPVLKTLAFKGISRSLQFPSNVDLPGRIWSSGTPIWIENIQIEQNFPRSMHAQEVGLHAAVGFPILVQNQVLGVMEFFNREIQKPDASLFNTLDTLAPLIGHFMGKMG